MPFGLPNYKIDATTLTLSSGKKKWTYAKVFFSKPYILAFPATSGGKMSKGLFAPPSTFTRTSVIISDNTVGTTGVVFAIAIGTGPTDEGVTG